MDEMSPEALINLSKITSMVLEEVYKYHQKTTSALEQKRAEVISLVLLTMKLAPGKNLQVYLFYQLYD